MESTNHLTVTDLQGDYWWKMVALSDLRWHLVAKKKGLDDLRWVIDDPDEYLDPVLHAGSLRPPSDWHQDYARWRYCYAPGIQFHIRSFLGGLNCAAFTRIAAQLEAAAVRLIPEEIMAAVPPQQPDDWTGLPARQIERLWNAKNVLLSKVVICFILIDLAERLSAGALPGYRFDRKLGLFVVEPAPSAENGEDAPNTNLDIDDIVKKASALEDQSERSVFKALKVQLAAYHFVNHDADFWHQSVIANAELNRSFLSKTHQRAAFLTSMADGELFTVATSRFMQEWLSKHFPSRVDGIAYRYHEPPRVRAARKERTAPHIPKPERDLV